MRNRYFMFLHNIVGVGDNYILLLDELFRTEFYSLIPNDDNRGEDGKNLRQQFLDEVGPTGAPSLPKGPCTVLEMLIALADRLVFETANSRWEKTTKEWFWVLIDNLGLFDCDDPAFNKGYGRDKAVEIIGKFLAREYDSDGNGGLFPLKNPRKDQRRVEIWYQMSAYILENYPM